METKCPECGQLYRITDKVPDSRKAYFSCERCGCKVTLNREMGSWDSFRVFAHKLLTIGNLPESLTLSFNAKIVGTTYLFIFAITSLAGIFGMTLYASRSFFSGKVIAALFFAAFFYLIIAFLWDMMLYLVSKNSLSLIQHRHNYALNADFPGFRRDMLLVFIISFCLPLVFGIVLLPMMLMGPQGILYAGIINPVLFAVSVTLLLTLVSKNILMAFIALKPRTFRFTFIEFGKFIAVEHINIFFYVLVIGFIRSMVGAVLIIFMAAGFAYLGPGLFAPAVKGLVTALMTGGLHDAAAVISTNFQAIDFSMAGILFLITSAVIALFFAAYAVACNQVLFTSSIYIMQKNPGTSVPRGMALLLLAGAMLVMGLLF